MIRLGNLTAIVQLQEAAFGDPDWGAMMEQNIFEIKQLRYHFNHHFAAF